MKEPVHLLARDSGIPWRIREALRALAPPLELPPDVDARLAAFVERLVEGPVPSLE